MICVKLNPFISPSQVSELSSSSIRENKSDFSYPISYTDSLRVEKLFKGILLVEHMVSRGLAEL